MKDVTIDLLKKVSLVIQYILVKQKVMSRKGYAWQHVRLFVSIEDFSVYCLVLVDLLVE